MWRTDSLSSLFQDWFWERLKAGGEGDDRGWDGWMASLSQWTWVRASSRSWWRTGVAWLPLLFTASDQFHGGPLGRLLPWSRAPVSLHPGEKQWGKTFPPAPPNLAKSPRAVVPKQPWAPWKDISHGHKTAELSVSEWACLPYTSQSAPQALSFRVTDWWNQRDKGETYLPSDSNLSGTRAWHMPCRISKGWKTEG